MVPDGWEQTTLEGVAQRDGLQTGPFGSQLKASEYTPDGIPVVMPKDLISARVSTADIARIPQARADDLEIHKVQRGDILFGRRGDIGRCGLVTDVESGWICGTGCLRARLSSEVDPQFLIHHLQSRDAVEWLTDHAVGQTMLNLNTKILGALPLLLPPVSEQSKIAAILSSVDDAIARTQAVIDGVQTVKKGLMSELLTHGLPGRHTRFKKTEIGVVPEGWEVRRAIDLCDRIVVGIVVKPAQYYTSQGVPCLRSMNVREDRIQYEEIKFISAADNAQLAKSMLRTGDVLTVRTGYPGTSAVVPADLDGANCVDLIITTPGQSLLGSFLSRFVNSSAGRVAVESRQGGLAQQHFNVGAMKQMLIPLPPVEEQREICDILDATDLSVAQNTASLDGLEAIKSSLMSVLLTGQLRVTVDNEAA